MTKSCTIPFEKETKNMLQFQMPKDKRDTVPIPTVYIRKDAFDSSKPWPTKIKISFE